MFITHETLGLIPSTDRLVARLVSKQAGRQEVKLTDSLKVWECAEASMRSARPECVALCCKQGGINSLQVRAK